MLIWYAVLTNPRCEAKAVAGLRERGFDVYLPEETRLKRSKANARERVNRPLFPGYLFVGLNPDCGAGLYHVRLQDGVRGVVASADGRPARIGHVVINGEPVRIVDWLRSRQAMGEFDYTPARRTLFSKGHRAKLTHGQFKGHVGTMTEADTEGRIRIELEGLFKGGIWIDDDHIEAVAA